MEPFMRVQSFAHFPSVASGIPAGAAARLRATKTTAKTTAKTV
jgi:hypothetical protein